MSTETAIGNLHGTILALRLTFGWTPEQVHAEVGRALKEAREVEAEREREGKE